MIDTQASLRYANALFILAKEKGELEKIDTDFVKFIELLNSHKEISHLVLNSTISRSEIEDLISKVFGQKISGMLLNFIKVVIRKARFDQIQSMQEKYHAFVEREMGIQEVCVITASSLSAAAREKLTSMLAQKLGFKIRLVEEIDDTMIGGFILRFDGKEINSSFRHRLSELRQILRQ